MNKTLIAAALIAVFSAPAVRADAGSSCHFHGSKPASETTVLGCATQRKETLVKARKLEAGWLGIKHETIALVDGKKGKEWKVSFTNPSVEDKDKKTLYMFFTPVGNFVAANFSGQ